MSQWLQHLDMSLQKWLFHIFIMHDPNLSVSKVFSSINKTNMYILNTCTFPPPPQKKKIKKIAKTKQNEKKTAANQTKLPPQKKQLLYYKPKQKNNSKIKKQQQQKRNYRTVS